MKLQIDLESHVEDICKNWKNRDYLQSRGSLASELGIRTEELNRLVSEYAVPHIAQKIIDMQKFELRNGVVFGRPWRKGYVPPTVDEVVRQYLGRVDPITGRKNPQIALVTAVMQRLNEIEFAKRAAILSSNTTVKERVL